MGDNVVLSRVLLPDISVELRTIGVLGLGWLGTSDDCSTYNKSESFVSGEIGRNIFIFNGWESAAEKYELNLERWLALPVMIIHRSSGWISFDAGQRW